MNTEKLNQLKQKVGELLTIDNAKRLITQAKDNAPTKEQIDTSIKTLQEVLHNVYVKSLQGASSVSTVYQHPCSAYDASKGVPYHTLELRNDIAENRKSCCFLKGELQICVGSHRSYEAACALMHPRVS